MNKNSILHEFGNKLIEEVRDEVIETNDLIMLGKMGALENIDLYERFKSTSPNTQQLIRDFVRESVDKTIHHFLLFFEQYEDYDLVKYSEDKKEVVSLRDISDGLCGELYTEDGWIEKYSKYPPSIK